MMIKVKNHHTPPTIRPDKDLREKAKESRRANKSPQTDQLGKMLTISNCLKSHKDRKLHAASIHRIIPAGMGLMRDRKMTTGSQRPRMKDWIPADDISGK